MEIFAKCWNIDTSRGGGGWPGQSTEFLGSRRTNVAFFLPRCKMALGKLRCEREPRSRIVFGGKTGQVMFIRLTCDYSYKHPVHPHLFAVISNLPL